MVKLLLLLLTVCSMLLAESYIEHGKEVTLTPIPQGSRTDDASPNRRYFQTERGFQVSVDNQILVKVVSGTFISSVTSGISLDKKEEISTNLWLLTLSTDEDVFASSKKLTERDDVEFAHPNFTRERRKR